MNNSSSLFSRRSVLMGAGFFSAGASASLLWTRSQIAGTQHHGLELSDPQTADDALARLVAGNRCYVDEHFAIGDVRRSPQRRLETSERQWPYAVILSCSDSRVGPEIIFSAGLGDLFVVRVAGNIVDPRCYGVLGSLEYAVEELKVPLVMVLGHENCGAVKAAIRVIKENVKLPAAIAMIADVIRPTVEAVVGQPGELLPQAVVSNVKSSVGRLRTDEPILSPLIQAETLKIVGAVYDLKTGLVRVLE